MLPLLTAVFVASLMGSMHCVGMCGPLALWASGAGRIEAGGAKRKVFAPMVVYHLGRLTTYCLAGLVAGVLGAAVTSGGQWLGMQSLAARLVGAGMIVFAIIRLAKWAFPQWWAPSRIAVIEENGGPLAAGEKSDAGWSLRISRWVAAQRPRIARMPFLLRGYAAGALTTLLPCGWLYLFVLIAMGSGGVVPSMVVMVAFWLGTVPALTALVVGAFRIAPRVRPWLPLAGSLLLLITGLYTATGRAEADLRPLALRAAELSKQASQASLPVSAESPASAERIVNVMGELVREPLPCCVDRKDRSE